MSSSRLGPCALEGKFVRLEPLRVDHAEALFEAAKKLDQSLLLNPLLSREAVMRRIESGLRSEEEDDAYAFAVVMAESGKVVGSTSYLYVVSGQRRLEIGSTWYSPDQWGTAVNPESKFLLLKHAFEDWGAVRVQLVTDVRNLHSQRAITKLGAKFEGRMRNHGIMPDGFLRESMLYSITVSEWPDVKSKLLARIGSYG